MNFESQLFQYLENLKNNLRIQPMFLGGTASWSGGIGGPPGGFIGYLPQTRVAYDFGEIASSDLPISGMSLWDNLNHIRYRIQQLENGGVSPSGTSTTLIVKEDGTIVASGVYVIDFTGATVTDLGDGEALISINIPTPSGGGDMYKSVYDTDDDGIVDEAASVAWEGIIGTPTTFPPESHTHDDRYYTEVELATEGQASVHWGNLTDVPTISGTGIEDAPSDGNLYGRRNGIWEEIIASGITPYIMDDYIQGSLVNSTEVMRFISPVDATISGIYAGVGSKESGSVLLDINVNGDSILSSNLTIVDLSGNIETSAEIKAGDIITVDIDDAGTDSADLFVSVYAVVTGDGKESSVGYQTLTDQANITWDLSNGSAGVTLGGNRTLSNPTNMAAGQFYFLLVTQDSTGGRTLAFGNNYKFPSNIKPTLSTYQGTTDVLTFVCDGTYMIYTGIVRNTTNSDPALTYQTNLLMWLKADAGVYSDSGTTLCQDEDAVYHWEDQSGNGNHAIQTTVENRPTYHENVLNNRPAILFDGVGNQFVVTDMNGGDNVSFFIVIVPGDTLPCGLIDTTAGDVPPIRNDPAGNWDWYYYQPGTDITLPNTHPVLLEFIHTQSGGRSVSYYRNGGLISTNTDASETPTAWGDPRIGSNNDGSEGWYNGYIAEFLIYSESLTSANRQTVENYLKAKYGI